MTQAFRYVGGNCHNRSEKSLFPAPGDILQASDNLSRVINSYKTIIEGQVINGEVATLTLPDSEGEMLWSPTLDSRPASGHDREAAGVGWPAWCCTRPEGVLCHSKQSFSFPEAWRCGWEFPHLLSQACFTASPGRDAIGLGQRLEQ